MYGHNLRAYIPFFDADYDNDQQKKNEDRAQNPTERLKTVVKSKKVSVDMIPFECFDCKVEDFEQGDDYIVTFHIIARAPNYDRKQGMAYEHRFEFALNILTGQMALRLFSDGRRGATYTGYLVTLR